MYKIAFKIDDSLYSLILFTHEIFTANKIVRVKGIVESTRLF